MDELVEEGVSRRDRKELSFLDTAAFTITNILTNTTTTGHTTTLLTGGRREWLVHTLVRDKSAFTHA